MTTHIFDEICANVSFMWLLSSNTRNYNLNSIPIISIVNFIFGENVEEVSISARRLPIEIKILSLNCLFLSIGWLNATFALPKKTPFINYSEKMCVLIQFIEGKKNKHWHHIWPVIKSRSFQRSFHRCSVSEMSGKHRPHTAIFEMSAKCTLAHNF